MKSQLTKESFLENVKNHTLNIVRADGVERRIICSNNGSFNQRFEIVTFPHHLLLTGDMGCNVFSRTHDMFTFFNNKIDEGVNYSYWGEKLQNVGDGTEFCEDTLRTSIQQHVENICENIDHYFENAKDSEYTNVEDFESAFRYEVKEYFEECLDECRYVSMIENFDSEVIDDLEWLGDYDWVDYKAFSHRFMWHCWAIVWCIEKFHEFEAEIGKDETGKVIKLGDIVECYSSVNIGQFQSKTVSLTGVVNIRDNRICVGDNDLAIGCAESVRLISGDE